MRLMLNISACKHRNSSSNRMYHSLISKADVLYRYRFMGRTGVLLLFLDSFLQEPTLLHGWIEHALHPPDYMDLSGIYKNSSAAARVCTTLQTKITARNSHRSRFGRTVIAITKGVIIADSLERLISIHIIIWRLAGLTGWQLWASGTSPEQTVPGLEAAVLQSAAVWTGSLWVSGPCPRCRPTTWKAGWSLCIFLLSLRDYINVNAFHNI